MDILPLIIGGAFTFLGGGVTKALVDGWNRRKSEAQKLRGELERAEHALDLKTEDTARHFLQDLARDERQAHKECLQRLQAIEAEMFRQQYDHGKEKERSEATITRLTRENGDMRREMALMRDALLALYTGDRSKAKSLIDSLPPARPVPTITEVDGRTNKS